MRRYTMFHSVITKTRIGIGMGKKGLLTVQQQRERNWSKYYYYDRCFFSSQDYHPEPTIDVVSFQENISTHVPTMTQSLIRQGFYMTPGPYSLLPKETIQKMREQSIDLRRQGRFEPSWSEKIDDAGKVTRFDKEGVFACEPDGQDYDTAPDLIMYMSVLLQTLPELLNSSQQSSSTSKEGEAPTEQPFGLSMSSFNAKLAVTSPGGSIYPMHIDNPQGLSAGDTRKLTCILYLNPDYVEGDGGQLRIMFSSTDNPMDITPDGGRMVMFWSDEIPHEVLPTAPESDPSDLTKDRYALTLWIPTDNYQAIHNTQSKFATLSEDAFQCKRT